jgi:nucleotide-binding universal stress UspA family protein
MSAARRLLVALSGAEDPALVAELAGLVDPARPEGPPLEIQLLHVVDSGPRGLLPFGPGPRRGPWPKPPEGSIESRLTGAEDEAAVALLAKWSDRFATGLPGATITTEVRRGHPEHEIIVAATAYGASAVVLCARPRTGPTEPVPRSVGHVARFVLDHAPVPVLLVRRSA